jgi:hypothetical protein
VPERTAGWVLMHPGWSGGDLMSAHSVGHVRRAFNHAARGRKQTIPP